MFESLKEIPAAARWLGFSGLIPFVGAAVGVLAGEPALQEFSLRMLLGYSAVILSFLGGVRWGLAITKTDSTALLIPLTISVTPSLLGWVALLLPPASGFLTLAIGFAAMQIADTRLPQAPHWYRVLRFPLSAGAISALIIGLTVLEQR